MVTAERVKREMLRPWRLAKNIAERTRYALPNLRSPSVPMSPRAGQLLAQLRSDGLIRIDGQYKGLAEYLDATYFDGLMSTTRTPAFPPDQPGLFAIDIDTPKRPPRKMGASIDVNISFKDPQLEPLLFDADLNAILYNYYRRQPYYRNQPRLYLNRWDGHSTLRGNAQYHVDVFHQISLMLLVNDLQPTDMHMKYALRSHRDVHLIYNKAMPNERVEGRYAIADLVGEKGTLYVFDAAGIHRGYYTPNTTRKILHLNVTPGHGIEPGRYDLLDTWRTLDRYPKHSRRMMDRVGMRYAFRAYY
jgi:hypothetical protein